MSGTLVLRVFCGDTKKPEVGEEERKQVEEIIRQVIEDLEQMDPDCSRIALVQYFAQVSDRIRQNRPCTEIIMCKE